MTSSTPPSSVSPNQPPLTQVAAALPGIRRDVPLARYTTFRIGGPADLLYEARSADALERAVTVARQAGLPVFVLGGGANILVGDGGVRGLVVLNRAAHVSWSASGCVEAESGIMVGELLRQAVRRGWSGLEHFAGIPGTLGGSLRQNLHFLSPAPARTRTMFLAEIVESCTIATAAGRTALGREALAFGYDDSRFHHHPDEVVLSSRLQLTPADPTMLRRIVSENLAWRRDRHPPFRRLGNAGSIFKKIDGVGAGRLIDAAGLKGRRIGGAEVSALHANFIVNRARATASDVRALIALVQEEVARTSGYHLEPEIGFIGSFSS